MNTQKPITKRLPQIHVSFEPKRSMKDRLYLTNSNDVYKLSMHIWDLKTISLYEEFYVFFLDRRNGVIGYRHIGKGTVHAVTVNKKLIFAIALKCNASGIILCHNHPSGNPDPGHLDHKLTNEFSDAAKLFDMTLHDHLIISRESYYSFVDEGRLL